MMPAAARAMKSDVPPWEIKTSGTPVKGNSPSSERILRKDCAVSSVTKPMTMYCPKLSDAFSAILKPRIARNT